MFSLRPAMAGRRLNSRPHGVLHLDPEGVAGVGGGAVKDAIGRVERVEQATLGALFGLGCPGDLRAGRDGPASARARWTLGV
jgi:hypothetical protein